MPGSRVFTRNVAIIGRIEGACAQRGDAIRRTQEISDLRTRAAMPTRLFPRPDARR